MSPDRPSPSRLFLLVGPPAVGKLSIAREIGRRSGAIVVDNHLVNNAVFVPMGLDRGGRDLADTDALRARVLDVVLEATLAAPAGLSHVFTNWLPEDPDNAAHVQRLRDLASQRGARFVPVWLTASADELSARVDSPERAERSKLVDAGVLRELLAIPSLPAPSDAIEVDTSQMSVEQAAAHILESSRVPDPAHVPEHSRPAGPAHGAGA
ncbi:AAA family ATPase [Brachybacterium sp. MASK1Z-5]|uniref:AAA family ATPase n=1 Tax=Brachybacterium halotolerans TaxID=2795215 RepID=A0ABS1BEH7_9MICO|nr:AAA family ATPase [Brachybacterium halotolerans]MBK0333030.1 AAA family ATPase [Brachybacterium halotolerans]